MKGKRECIKRVTDYISGRTLELGRKELCAGNKDQLALESREVMSAGAMHHALLQTGKEC
ncbi:hypothetical protein V1478_013874 [Vespula squamosa]|uniref:Uncharacterized protein n=1 Tax=Vespula squamosa TaxID=30214 RepID=A0ABD2A6F1_VESSQ